MIGLLAACAPYVPATYDDPPGAVLDTAGHPVVPELVLDEVEPRNDSVWMAPDGGFPDWVELYNAGNAPVELGTVTLTAEGGEVWTGAAGSLAPGARLFLTSDDLGFDLDAEGDTLELAVAGLVTDRLATGDVAGDTAWARFPDGGAWAYTARPTPGEPNGSSPGTALDPSDLLFPADDVLDFDLQLSRDAVASLDRDPYTEVEGALGFGPAYFSRVGVRLKGVLGSLRDMDGKASFKIDLDAYDDHRLRGLESLTFNNMVQDPSYVHETLAYRFYRQMGLPAPRTAYMRLTVNGELWGVYVLVESVDPTFLARWYANPHGQLYEGAYGVDFVVGQEDEFELDAGDEDRSDLTRVAEVLELPPTDGNVASLERYVDLDQVLSELATEAILLHWDGYTTANNYRVYDNPDTGRFQMLPWGTDQTLHDDIYGPYDGIGRLLQFCLANAACSDRYDDALLAAADTFADAQVGDWMDEALDVVGPILDDDVRAEQSADTIASWQAQTRDVIDAAPHRIRVDVADHGD